MQLDHAAPHTVAHIVEKGLEAHRVVLSGKRIWLAM